MLKTVFPTAHYPEYYQLHLNQTKTPICAQQIFKIWQAFLRISNICFIKPDLKGANHSMLVRTAIEGTIWNIIHCSFTRRTIFYAKHAGVVKMWCQIQIFCFRVETLRNFVCCESTTVSQRPLLDPDDIHTLRKSIFTKLCRNQYKPHQE